MKHQFTLYARKEPAVGSTLDKYWHIPLERLHDVRVFRDKEATESVFTIPWHSSREMTRRNKWIMYNCFRYRLEWLPELKK